MTGSVVPVVLLAVAVVAHGLLPVLLAASAARAARPAAVPRRTPRDPRRIWATGTVLLAALVVAVLPVAGIGVPAPFPPDPLAAVLWTAVAVVAGIALPTLAPRLGAWLRAGRGQAAAAGVPQPFRRAIGPRSAVSLIAVAAGEEVLWRLAAPALLIAVGVSAGAALPLAALGFALLHLPGYGWARMPYLLVVTALLSTLGALGGVLVAVAAHAAHNIAVATTARRPVRRAHAVAATSSW